MVELMLCFHTHRFLNATSELQIAPKYCMLKAFPSILVWRDPWFRQIAWSFHHTISIIHRIHCSEEYVACLPLLMLFPPGIDSFRIVAFNSLAFPTW